MYFTHGPAAYLRSRHEVPPMNTLAPKDWPTNLLLPDGLTGGHGDMNNNYGRGNKEFPKVVGHNEGPVWSAKSTRYLQNFQVNASSSIFGLLTKDSNLLIGVQRAPSKSATVVTTFHSLKSSCLIRNGDSAFHTNVRILWVAAAAAFGFTMCGNCRNAGLFTPLQFENWGKKIVQVNVNPNNGRKFKRAKPDRRNGGKSKKAKAEPTDDVASECVVGPNNKMPPISSANPIDDVPIKIENPSPINGVSLEGIEIGPTNDVKSEEPDCVDEEENDVQLSGAALNPMNAKSVKPGCVDEERKDVPYSDAMPVPVNANSEELVDEDTAAWMADSANIDAAISGILDQELSDDSGYESSPRQSSLRERACPSSELLQKVNKRMLYERISKDFADAAVAVLNAENELRDTHAQILLAEDSRNNANSECLSARKALNKGLRDEAQTVLQMQRANLAILSAFDDFENTLHSPLVSCGIINARNALHAACAVNQEAVNANTALFDTARCAEALYAVEEEDVCDAKRFNQDAITKVERATKIRDDVSAEYDRIFAAYQDWA
jgi:hypothetical protein